MYWILTITLKTHKKHQNHKPNYCSCFKFRFLALNWLFPCYTKAIMNILWCPVLSSEFHSYTEFQYVIILTFLETQSLPHRFFNEVTFWTWLISSCLRFWFLVSFLSGPSTSTFSSKTGTCIPTSFCCRSTLSIGTHSSKRLLTKIKEGIFFDFYQGISFVIKLHIHFIPHNDVDSTLYALWLVKNPRFISQSMRRV